MAQKTGNAVALESYGQQGHLGGWITSHLQGRTIECLMRDGVWLILRFTDGHEARIGWQHSGNQVLGEPFLENLDARIFVPGAGLTGTPGTPGKPDPKDNI